MPHVFTASKCVVATTSAPRWRKCCTMAVARAPPSLGSVPVPTSSSSTSAGSASSRSIDTRLVMCAEKVLRLAVIDCSSPMSANTLRNTGSRAVAAGTCRPAWAISAKSPAVLSATVLPPVLGPVMSSTRLGGSRRTSTGTARSSSGCRAPVSSREVSAVNAGSMPFTRALCRALACSTSTAEATSRSTRRSAGRWRKRSVSSNRMRKISARSLSSSSTMSLLSSTVAAGSRKSVAPLAELPCTMPGTWPRCSARTISTKRPLRSVTTSSCRYLEVSLPRVNDSRVPRSLPRFCRSSLRMRRNSGLASSCTSPPASMARRTAVTSSANDATWRARPPKMGKSAPARRMPARV